MRPAVPRYEHQVPVGVRGGFAPNVVYGTEYHSPTPPQPGSFGLVEQPPGFSRRAVGAPLLDLLARIAEQDAAAAEVEKELEIRLSEIQHRRRGLKSAADAAEAELRRLKSAAAAVVNDGAIVGSASWPGRKVHGIAGSREANALDAPVPSAQASFLGAVPKPSPPPPPSRSNLTRGRRAVSINVGRPVGLPNRGGDCFWLSAMQCLRHTPGFARAMSVDAPNMEEQPTNLYQAVSKLLFTMQMAELDGQLTPDSQALSQFQFHAMQALPASDGNEKLVQANALAQRQQDAHEFLHQLLDYLGSAHPDIEVSSPRRSPDRHRLEALETELTRAAKVNASNADHSGAKEWARKTAFNLLYEYCMIQWSASDCRMKSRAVGNIFEGQRLASMSCRNCGRFCASGAEAFVIEEVRLADATEDAGWLGRIGGLFGGGGRADKVSLEEVLRQSAESPAPEGYICPNVSCRKVGTSARKQRLFRLPSTLVLHINRAQSDGSRCEIVLDFQPTLELNSLGMVVHFGSPLDRALEPCVTQYSLYATVFHRGPNARSGHYFAYVLCGDAWMRVDDSRVVQPMASTKATPMDLEASEPAEGARVSLLFYQRKAQQSS